MTTNTNINRSVVLAALIFGAVIAACLIAWATKESNDAVKPAVPKPNAAKQYQLLKFSGSWCLTCRSQASRLKAKDIQRLMAANNVKEIDVDIDKEPQTAAAWDVTTVPVVILVEVDKHGRGNAIRKHVGLLSSKDLAVFVDPTKEFHKPE